MEKIWLKNYLPGTPAEIDISQYDSLVEILTGACERFHDRKAFTNLGTSISYSDLKTMSQNFAAFLQRQLGLQKGDRIAIMLPNLLQYPVAMFGALQAGLVLVNVNPLYTPSELSHILHDAGCETIIILENFAYVLEAALPKTPIKHIIMTRVGDLFPFAKRIIVNFVVKYVKKMVPAWQLPQFWDFNAALAMGGRLPFDKVTITSGDIAYLQYTGGTTGIRKGAILSHSNLIANMFQLYHWVKPVITEGEMQIVVTALPLYHIFSLTVNCLTFTLLGGNNVLITNPREMTDMIKQIRHLRFSVITGVNTLFNAMLHHPHFAEVDFSHLHLSLAGGMAVQRSVAERWKKVTGNALIEGYGLTEASPVVTANLLNLKEYSGSIGLPLPSTDVSIRDEDNNELPIGAEGELCVRGPQVMRGYWGAPEETKGAFTVDGWLRTGDIAKVDSEGFFYLIDRKDDMIIVSGFNVYPNEVEDVIAKHPGVLEVAVIGVPDVQSGEMVKALVVKKDPNLTAQEIIDFCHQFLTRYKVPHIVEFRDQLPKTNVGKILRRALRE